MKSDGELQEFRVCRETKEMRIMVTRGMVAYLVRVFKERDMYSRTRVQKTLYFLISDEDKDRLYEPIRESGMYSSSIQVILQFLEKNYNLMKTWSYEVDKEFKKKVEKFLNLNLRIVDLVLLAKMDFLIRNFGEDFELIKDRAKILGWGDVLSMSELEIRKVKEMLKMMKDVLVWERR